VTAPRSVFVNVVGGIFAALSGFGCLILSVDIVAEFKSRSMGY
jgi:hypothetical protein